MVIIFKGVLSNICFDDEDIDFAAGHDLFQSACWGKAESVIVKIRERSNAIFSFDFAHKLDHPIIESTTYHIIMDSSHTTMVEILLLKNILRR